MIQSATVSPTLEIEDAELVVQSRAGNRDAFGRIVAKYQSLVCSVAYGATGSISRSEDLAQETFLTAWQQLHRLREPHRLRAWICGITRNLIRNTFRQQAREPVHQAEPLDVVAHAPSSEAPPLEQAISREEETLLWSLLERIPEPYREPLILFYRQHQSVERVAEALELSPDAVKQRLARGRRMLQGQVTAFVAGALERTAPGKTFTLGVLSALPLLAASSATAAAAGGAAAKAGMAAKTAAAAGLAGAVIGPAIGILGGAFGSWVSIRNTRSPRERQFMIRQTWICWIYVLAFLAAFFALAFGKRQLAIAAPALFGFLIGFLIVAYCAGLLVLAVRGNRRQRQIRLEDGTASEVSLPCPIPTRGQMLWTVYGSLGGATAGSLTWLVIQAVQTAHWLTALVTMLFGGTIVLAGGRVWLRDPEKRIRVILQTLALLGLFIVGAGLAHWRDWAIGARDQATAPQIVLVGSGMAVVAVLIAGIVWFKGRSR